MILAELEQAAKQGAELIELRLDFLAKSADFKRLLANKPCPMIATVRRQQEGGRWKGTEEERQMLLRQCIVGGFDWVDLETDIADKIRRFGKVKRIISYHNTRDVPADLEKIHQRMLEQDPDVVKLAVRADDPSDNLRLLRLIQSSPKPTIGICLGDVGTASRVLSAKYGAPFTYAAFNKERGIAPGILGFDEMQSVYRYEDIHSDTKVYGVIGDPVAQSLSPLVHNAAFKAHGLNCVYVPFRVQRNELEGFLKDFDQVPVHGYSVTIPHKEAAATLAQEKDSTVEWIQAANTLVRREDGTFAAYNTDCPAAVESLRGLLAQLEFGESLSGRTVLILGAGGGARAIAHGLHREGALLVIANRTAERAHQLAEEVGCRASDWTARHSFNCEIVVNCTSVGMFPNLDESPLHHSFLRPGLIVFDTVYNPETTFLIKEARDRGCAVLSGVDMFVRQAALQFKLFTGIEPSLDLMRKVVKRALSPVTVREPEEVQ
jgi:3-dehydroquinate dehydratase/shikimate dehydrogenase